MTKLTSSRALPNVVLCLCLGLLTPSAFAQGELRFCLRSEPKTFDPLQVEDDASVAIRYLTGGTLVRMNRQSQVLEPELAQSWKAFKRRQADYIQVAQRDLVLRRNAIFGRRRCLYRSTVDGPFAALAHRRCIPLRTGECRDEDSLSYADFHHLSCSGCGTRSPIRSSRTHVVAFSQKRDGRARAVHGGRLQARSHSAAEAKSQLLEDRRAGTQVAVSGFDSSSTSSRIVISKCFASSATKSI